ncbi:MAG: hypothetical protein [Microvirus sp.]|nr:MAG: hypothetical protein [Microvirus sp.]
MPSKQAKRVSNSEERLPERAIRRPGVEILWRVLGRGDPSLIYKKIKKGTFVPLLKENVSSLLSQFSLSTNTSNH